MNIYIFGALLLLAGKTFKYRFSKFRTKLNAQTLGKDFFEETN
jgi:hypothetical protein